MNAARDLQEAIVAALKADPALVAILGGEDRIIDAVPSGRSFPFVAIGRATASDWSTDDREGEEHLVVVRCWSRATSRAEVLAMTEGVSTALRDFTGLQGATRIVAILPVSLDHGWEPGDLAWRATLRFRALTEPA